jgi:hypothetical protein
MHDLVTLDSTDERSRSSNTCAPNLSPGNDRTRILGHVEERPAQDDRGTSEYLIRHTD